MAAKLSASSKLCFGSGINTDGRSRAIESLPVWPGVHVHFYQKRRCAAAELIMGGKQATLAVNGNSNRGRDTKWAAEGDNGVRKKVRVAYQGIPGAFSEAAATTAHPGCEGVPCKGYEDAIWAVESRKADRAILPVEGTLEGNAVRNYDLLLHHSLHIVEEIRLFVNYCLLVAPGVRKEQVRRVMSHPMALAHCSHGLKKLGLDVVTREAVDDTAGAAEFVHSRGLRDTAAIASCRAAEIYGLDVVARNVQDEPWNVTRFLVLARQPYTDDDNVGVGAIVGVNRAWKTSIVIAHEGGLDVLLKLLSVFSFHNISLTKLEVNPQGSAPLRVLDIDAKGGAAVRQFEYVFYIDFEASEADPHAQRALEEVRRFATFVRVLGCYVSRPKIHTLDP